MISKQYNKTHYLYNIASIDNLETIFQYGILSNKLIKQKCISHVDISDKEVQLRRDRVIVPGGLELHAYANLYFNPRNAMLYKIRDQINNICILRIDKRVLDLKTTIIADANASVAGTCFWTPEEALTVLKFKTIYSETWDYPDYGIKRHYKQKMMAEVLVLDKINKDYIVEILVPNDIVYKKVMNMNLNIPVTIDEYKFFIK